MSDLATLSMTQRAYTLRLDCLKDSSWRERLWMTHEKVNIGAKMFGDFLLTLRGGVKPSGECKDPVSRRLLALCWFSVESEIPETAAFRIETQDSAEGRKADATAMQKTLKDCLTTKGIQSDGWWDDCRPALLARIRDHSVWVQRWKAFEELNEKPLVEEIDYVMSSLLGGNWLSQKRDKKKKKPLKTDAVPDQDAAGDAATDKPGSEDESVGGKARNQGRQLCCDWFGGDKKSGHQKTGKKKRGPRTTKDKNEALQVFIDRIYDPLKGIADDFLKNKPENASEIKKRILKICEERAWNDFQDGLIVPKNKKENEEEKPLDKKSLKGIWGTWSKIVELVNDNSDLKNYLHDPNGCKEDKLCRACNGWKNISKKAAKKSEDLRKKTSRTGKPGFKNELESKLGMSYQSCPKEFFYEMAGLGAQAFAKTHSWQRRAEAARHEKEEIREKNKPDENSPAVIWLNEYLEKRSEDSGSRGLISISKNALDGWDEIFKRWKKLKPNDRTEERLLDVTRAVQDVEEKFGDAALFRALARDEARRVWEKSGTADDSEFRKYAAWSRAEETIHRFKVPSYRHPDPFEHPIFCEFGNSRPSVCYGWQTGGMSHRHEIEMLLLDSNTASELKMRWRSARLNDEMGLGSAKVDLALGLSRNTRLSRQAAGDFAIDDRSGRLTDKMPAALQDTDKFNARLQVSRVELKRIGEIIEKNPRRKEELVGRLKWFVTFSPKLVRQGPWFSFSTQPEIKKALGSPDPPLKLRIINSKNKKFALLKFDKQKAGRREFERGWFLNGDSGWLVRPGLGTLPSIRVLGVDLGHRHGAIGAVWQQVPAEKIKTISGKNPPGDRVWFICDDPKRPEKIVKKNGKEKKYKPRLIFRRIGEDSWARLERQFMIRLPGELDDIRDIVKWEAEWLPRFLQEMGLKDVKLQKKITEARLEALSVTKSALLRHGDCIRIFHRLVSKKLPGMGGELPEVIDRKSHIEKALRLWDKLAHSPSWDGSLEKELWGRHIVPFSNSLKSPESNGDEDVAKSERKKREESYKQAANSLSRDNEKLREIGEEFKKKWAEDEKGWKARLKALRFWIARGHRYDVQLKKWVPDIAQKKHAGGLSLDRIASLTLLSQIQRAFAQRPTDEVLWRESKVGEKPGHAIREKLERLREDRLKKLANSVAMAALGLVGTEDDKMRHLEKNRQEGDRFAPVHAVAIENLDHYRPEASQTRRENRALMSWSAGEMSKRLGDACELHGLLLIQVQPNYTSRLCSRCGAPGVRCDRVKIKDLTDDWFWKKQLSKAEKAEKSSDATLLQKLLIKLKGDNNLEKSVLLPRNSGATFLCSNAACSVGSGGLQADMNAAATIGLRALMDGRWMGAYSYLPTKNSKPDPQANSLRGMPDSLKSVELATNDDAGGKGDTFNSFRDLSQDFELSKPKWKPYRQFWQDVLDKVVGRLTRVYFPAKNP